MQGNQRDRNRTMALECEFKGLSDQAVPKQLREYLKSLGFERAPLNNVLDRNRWTVRVDSSTVTSQRQASTWACETFPCDP